MPHNIYELTADSPFDAFASYDTSKWTKTEIGDTTVTFSTPSTGGNVAFANAGSGTFGISELEGSQSWGRNSNIMVDITANTMTPNAAGRGATLISEKDWIALVDASGRIDEETGGELPPSEALVMKDFGVTEDLRGEDGWRYQPESKESIEVTEAIGAE